MRQVVILLILTSLCGGATINVPGDFPTIQGGIDAAVDGDTILVAPGDYVITSPITFRGKALTLESVSGPEETKILMSDTPDNPERASVVVFESGEGELHVITKGLVL
jgi:hypothetical protein